MLEAPRECSLLPHRHEIICDSGMLSIVPVGSPAPPMLSRRNGSATRVAPIPMGAMYEACSIKAQELDPGEYDSR